MALFSDHEKIGKKFVPFAVSRNWTHLDFPDSILPEVIWIGFLPAHWDNKKGADLAVSLIELAFHETSTQPAPEFSFLSSHLSLSEADRARVVARLDRAGELAPIKEALLPFVRCYPKNNR